jgi:hypothetical protein
MCPLAALCLFSYHNQRSNSSVTLRKHNSIQKHINNTSITTTSLDIMATTAPTIRFDEAAIRKFAQVSRAISQLTNSCQAVSQPRVSPIDLGSRNRTAKRKTPMRTTHKIGQRRQRTKNHGPTANEDDHQSGPRLITTHHSPIPITQVAEAQSSPCGLRARIRTESIS